MIKEETLHLSICRYIKFAYPKVLFTSESSGLRVSINQAKKLKDMRSCSGLPDIMIFRNKKRGYKNIL